MRAFIRLALSIGIAFGLTHTGVKAQTLDAASVVARQPNFVTVMQQQCQQVQVPVQGTAPNVGGGVVGGVIGAALGNQIGRGDGKTVATAVGAVLGSLRQPTRLPTCSGFGL